MRIFVTGGTGFIGKPLVRKLLSEGHSLLLLVRKKEKVPIFQNSAKLKFLRGDLEDLPKFLLKIKSFKPDAVIHLAWEGIPSADIEINLRNLQDSTIAIESLVKVGIKKIFVAGSCHEYGEPGRRVNEKFPSNPFNFLYASKAALYLLASEICKKNSVRLIWGRIGFVYGPGQRKASLIPHLLNSIQKNKEPVLRNPKGGNDFIYVDDVANAIAMLIKKNNLGANEIYNISSGKLTGVMEIVKIIYKYAKLPLPKNLNIAKKPEGFWMDISKIKREISWRPKISIETGIKKVMKNNL